MPARQLISGIFSKLVIELLLALFLALTILAAASNSMIASQFIYRGL